MVEKWIGGKLNGGKLNGRRFEWGKVEWRKVEWRKSSMAEKLFGRMVDWIKLNVG